MAKIVRPNIVEPIVDVNPIVVRPKIGFRIKPETNKWFLDEPIENYSWTTSGEYTKNEQTYILPNNRKFPDWITKRFAEYRIKEDASYKCDDDVTGEKPLFPHQKFIKEYMSPTMP